MLVLSREAGSVLNLVKSDHIGVAIDTVTVDYTVPLSGIAPLLVRLVAFDD